MHPWLKSRTSCENSSGASVPCKVHVLRIGENDLHQAQRIRVAGLLPHHQMERPYSFQNLWTHLVVCYDLAFGRDDLKIVLGDVVRVLLNVPHDFGALNAGSHVPVRTEDNVLDRFLKNRRLVAVGLSNDYVLVEGDGAIRVHRAYTILGKVHHHRWLREGMRKPAPPFERQLDL